MGVPRGAREAQSSKRKGYDMAYIRKVGVLGQGHVGAHVANSLLMQGLADELYLCDINDRKLTSECQDFTDALSFYPHNCKIVNCCLLYTSDAADDS